MFLGQTLLRPARASGLRGLPAADGPDEGIELSAVVLAREGEAEIGGARAADTGILDQGRMNARAAQGLAETGGGARGGRADGDDGTGPVVDGNLRFAERGFDEGGVEDQPPPQTR